MDQHVLALISLNPDSTDGVGNLYTENGFVKCSNFQHNKDILSGLFGIAWGMTSSDTYVKNSNHWAVVKINKDDALICIDESHNVVKFEICLVVHRGNKRTSARYIADAISEHRDFDFNVNEIAGLVQEADLPNRHAIAQGIHGQAISNISALHAIAMARKTIALTTQPESFAISTGRDCSVAALDDNSIAIATADGSVAKSTGAQSSVIAVSPRSKAFSMGSDSVAFCLEPGCVASTGPNGVLIMAYEAADRVRYAVGYVGEDIRPNRIYRCEDDEFVLVS